MTAYLNLNMIPIGLGKSQNKETCGIHPERAPRIFLSLIIADGRVVGFEVNPDTTNNNHYGHCWCESLLRGLRGCGFAYIMTAGTPPGICFIAIGNEIVDDGRLLWEIPPDSFLGLKEAIQELQKKGDLTPYKIKRLGGTEELPHWDGFGIINQELLPTEVSHE